MSNPIALTITSNATTLPKPTTRSATAHKLRAGDWVEVLSAEEILATLDETGSLDGLPFMPEMLQYCGKRFRVFKSAHKSCDTIKWYVIRRMDDAVHLEDLRCDGEAHGGCQAGCLIFWKTAWLRKVASDRAVADTSAAPRRSEDTEAALAAVYRHTRVALSDGDAAERFRCQATEHVRASHEVRKRDRWNPLFYVKDVTSGNITVGELVRYGALAAFNAFLRHIGRQPYPQLCGLAGDKTPAGDTRFDAGDTVQVKSKGEIMRTLNSRLRNRGLVFDTEMVPFCENGTHKVLRRVEKIVNERTGEMMTIPNPCLILDGVTCSGNRSSARMFCSRAIYPYWREVWLKPAQEGTANGNSRSSTADGQSR